MKSVPLNLLHCGICVV